MLKQYRLKMPASAGVYKPIWKDNSRVTHTPDLNGDGKADLLWRKDDGTITAWLMDGAVPIATPTATAQLAGPNAYRVLPLPEAEVSAPVVLPSVTLTAPINNTTVGSPVTLTVSAQNIPATITTIEILDGANQFIGYKLNAVTGVNPAEIKPAVSDPQKNSYTYVNSVSLCAAISDVQRAAIWTDRKCVFDHDLLDQ